MNKLVLGAALGVSGMAAVVYPIWTRDRNELQSLESAFRLDNLFKLGSTNSFSGGFFQPWEVHFVGNNRLWVLKDRCYYVKITSYCLDKMIPYRPTVVDIEIDYEVDYIDPSANLAVKKGKFYFLAKDSFQKNMENFCNAIVVTYKNV